jgi:hypothetical protein
MFVLKKHEEKASRRTRKKLLICLVLLDALTFMFPLKFNLAQCLKQLSMVTIRGDLQLG